MANNELFYRVAREALDEDSSICCLIIDLNVAVESYLQSVDEAEPGEVQWMEPARREEEIRIGLIHLRRFLRDLAAFEVDAEPVTLTAPGKRVRDALSSILEYNWPAEQTDYEHAIEQGDIEPAPGSGHVYEALTIVRAYLDGTES